MLLSYFLWPIFYFGTLYGLVYLFITYRLHRLKERARQRHAKSIWELEGLPHHQVFGVLGAKGFDKDDIRGFLGRETQRLNNRPMKLCFPLTFNFSVLSSDPDDVRYILIDNFNNFQKGSKWRKLWGDLLGHGIFNSDGEQWRFQRKAASHLFSTKRLREFANNTFQRDSQLLAAAMKQHAETGTTIDLQTHMYALTFQSFMSLAFGVSEDVIGPIARNGDQPKFLTAFDQAVACTGIRFLTPWWMLLRLFQLGRERKLTEALATVKPYIQKIVDQRRNMSDAEVETRADLLSQYIIHARKIAAADQLTDEYLRDMITNFILAGRDTTASLLTSAFRMMDLYPAERDKLEQECDALFSEGMAADEEGLNFYELVKNAPLLDAFLMETLRLLPSVPTDFKVAKEDDVLPSGIFIPAGDRVTYNILGVQTNPRVWGDDSWDFDPGRWHGDTKRGPPLTESGSAHGLSTAFPAFNAGPRKCLGMTLALVEAKITLLTLMRNRIRFRVQDPFPVKEWTGKFFTTAVLTYRKFKGTAYLR